MEPFVTIALWVLGGLLSVIAWFVGDNIKNIKVVEQSINDHKVKVAETYVSRSTLQELLAPIMEELRKIDRTQERLFEALADKADKQ
jgi:hypothetical protein